MAGIDPIKGGEGTKQKEIYELMLKMGLGEGEKTNEILNNLAKIIPDLVVIQKDLFTGGSTTQDKKIQSGPTLKPSATGGAEKSTTTEALEKLIALLQMQTDNEQVRLAKERINNNKADMQKRHQEQMGKIQESIDAAIKAEKQRQKQKRLGWLFAFFAVVVAVVACVVTGGVAAGPVIGALLAVGMATVTQLDLMEKLQKKIQDSMIESGMSKKEAMVKSSLIMLGISLLIMAVSAACSGGADLGEKAKEVMQAIKIATMVASAVSMESQLEATFANYDAGVAQSDATKLNKILQQLQKTMEENQEELEKLMEMIQDCVSGLAAMLEKDTAAQDEIVRQLGAMGI